MNSFEKYAHLYQNLYTIEAWFIWLSLWLQYIGYYICLLGGILLIVVLLCSPIFIFSGLVRTIKIKIVSRKNKKSHQQKVITKMKEEYKKTLDQFDKRTKKKKHK